MLVYQYVVIVGCGRLGSILANRLSSLGSSVVVVDRDEAAFDNLSTEFSGFHVTGDAAELSVLRQARTEKADCVLALTRHDSVNLMVAQVSRSVFGVLRVIARVVDPSREPVYLQFGIETICPTGLSADALMHLLQPGPGRGPEIGPS
jgi:trk system potassium uptake protein TrkA